MKPGFYLGYVIPALLGLVFVWFQRRNFCHSGTKSALFLVAQIIIIRHYGGGTPYAAQMLVLILLAGYAAFSFLAKETNTPLELNGGLIFFTAYLSYWALEKYFLPLGWIGIAAQHALSIVHSLPSISAKRTGHLTDALAPLQSWLSNPVFVMAGISYIGFKLIHFFVDYRAGDIEKPRLLEFLSWLFFFPSIVAGPMIRFQDWQAQRNVSTLTSQDITDGLGRIIWGLFVKLVIADNIRGLTIADMTPGALSMASVEQIFLAACSYTVYLYCDFAGYSHIAIGMGRFWGINLPENFDAPYRARNLAEFWNRWHITLSHILRDYLFYPISLYIKRIRWFKKYPALATIIPPFITFVLAGIWHGAGLGFVIFGALHGIGLAYLALMKRYKTTNVFTEWWKDSRIAHICGTLITFFYVSFAFIFFCLTTDKLGILWHNLSSQL